MTAIQSLGGRLTCEALFPTAVVTATAAGATKVDLSAYDGSAFVALNGAAAGAGVTRLAKLRECDTVDGTYTDVAAGAFPDAGANTAEDAILQVNTNDLKQFVEIHFTVSGGSGTGAVGVQIIGQKKYNH